jgi:hypothetical protein
MGDDPVMPIRFRVRTIMITIAVSAAIMGGVRAATHILGISGVWIDGDAMALCVESERVADFNGKYHNSIHIFHTRTVTQLPLKPLFPFVIGAIALLSAILWFRGRRRRHVTPMGSPINAHDTSNCATARPSQAGRDS